MATYPQDPYASILPDLQPPDSGDPFDQLDTEFQQTYGKPLRFTGFDTSPHVRLHGKGKARDIGVRELSGDQLKFVLKRAPELGLNLRDYSQAVPHTTSTGVRITGPHVHLDRDKPKAQPEASDPYASILSGPEKSTDDPYAAILAQPVTQAAAVPSPAANAPAASPGLSETSNVVAPKPFDSGLAARQLSSARKERGRLADRAIQTDLEGGAVPLEFAGTGVTGVHRYAVEQDWRQNFSGQSEQLQSQANVVTGEQGAVAEAPGQREPVASIAPDAAIPAGGLTAAEGTNLTPEQTAAHPDQFKIESAPQATGETIAQQLAKGGKNNVGFKVNAEPVIQALDRKEITPEQAADWIRSQGISEIARQTGLSAAEVENYEATTRAPLLKGFSPPGVLEGTNDPSKVDKFLSPEDVIARARQNAGQFEFAIPARIVEQIHQTARGPEAAPEKLAGVKYNEGGGRVAADIVSGGEAGASALADFAANLARAAQGQGGGNPAALAMDTTSLAQGLRQLARSAAERSGEIGQEYGGKAPVDEVVKALSNAGVTLPPTLMAAGGLGAGFSALGVEDLVAMGVPKIAAETAMESLGFGAVGAMERLHEGPAAMGKAALENALLIPIYKSAGILKNRPLRMTATAAVSAGVPLALGEKMHDVIASGIIGLVLGAPGGSKSPFALDPKKPLKELRPVFDDLADYAVKNYGITPEQAKAGIEAQWEALVNNAEAEGLNPRDIRANAKEYADNYLANKPTGEEPRKRLGAAPEEIPPVGTRAVWQSTDGDIPVTVTGDLGVKNGRRFVSVAESKTGVPVDELAGAPKEQASGSDKGPVSTAVQGKPVASAEETASEAAATVEAKPEAKVRTTTATKGEADAETIRRDQGKLREARGAGTEGEGDRGADIHQEGIGRQPVKPGEGVARGQAEEQVAAPVRRLAHERFGEVTVADNQSGVEAGRLRVTDADGGEHVIQNPRLHGNQLAAFVKSAVEPAKPVAEPLPAEAVRTPPKPPSISTESLSKGAEPPSKTLVAAPKPQVPVADAFSSALSARLEEKRQSAAEQFKQRIRESRGGPKLYQEPGSQRIGIFNKSGKLVGTASLSESSDPQKWVNRNYPKGHTFGPLTMEGEGTKQIGSGKQTDTPEFKRWFGDAKVVDEKGEPLVRRATVKVASLDDILGIGDIETPSMTEGPVVLAVDRNGAAVDIIDGFHRVRAMLDEGVDQAEAILVTDPEIAKLSSPTALKLGDLIAAAAVPEGYNGTTQKEALALISEIADKSATGNRGTFDPKNPNILMQRNTPQTYDDIELPEDVKRPLLEIAQSFMAEGNGDYSKLVANFEKLLGGDFEYVVGVLPAIVAHAEKLQRLKTAPPEKIDLAPGEAKDKAAVIGKASRAVTPRGIEVQTRFALFESDQPITSHDVELRPNPHFPEGVQNRDRAKVSSEDDLQQKIARFEPEYLGKNIEAGRGAPIVGPDMAVESGNGRVIMLRRIYRDHPEQAAKYKAWLKENASKFGMTPAQVEAVKQPILAQIRATELSPAERIQFAEQANEDTQLKLSPVEVARGDARKLSAGLIAQFNPSEDGDILAASNREFVKGFLDQIVGPSRGDLLTSDGSLNQTGVDRVRNAIFARAYADTDAGVSALEKLAEETDVNTKRVINAMVTVAPRFVELKQMITGGGRYALDLSPDLAEAAKQLALVRQSGITVDEFLRQGQLFGENLSRVQKKLLWALNENARSATKLSQVLTNYLDAVDAIGVPRQQSFFSQNVPTKEELLEAAVRRIQDADQSNIATAAEQAIGGAREGLFTERPSAAATGTQATPAGSGKSADVAPKKAAASVTATDRQSFRKALIEQWGYPEEVAHRTSEVMEALAQSYVHDLKQSDAKTDAAKAKRAFYEAVRIAPAGEAGLRSLEQPALASTEFAQTGEAIIRAGLSPDESSAIHEIFHGSLPILARLADQPTAPATLKEAVGAILEHSGFESVPEYLRQHQAWVDGTATQADRDSYRKGSEKGARAWEGYFREGNAPTIALKAAFAKFKEWLSRIYQRVRPDMEMTDKVRRAFDRILGGEREQAALKIKEADHWNFKRSSFASPETEAKFRDVIRTAVVDGGDAHKTKVTFQEHLARVAELSPDLVPEVKKLRDVLIVSREIFTKAAQYSQALTNQAQELRSQITPATLPHEQMELEDKIAALEHDAAEIAQGLTGARSEFGRNMSFLGVQKDDQMSPANVLAIGKAKAKARGLDENSRAWRTAAQKLFGGANAIQAADKEIKRIRERKKRVEDGTIRPPNEKQSWQKAMLAGLKINANEASARLQELYGKKLYQEGSLTADEMDRVKAKFEFLKAESKKSGQPIKTAVDEYVRQGGLFGAELSPAQQGALLEMASPTRRAALNVEQSPLFDTSPTLESRREQSQIDKAGPSNLLFQLDKIPELARELGSSFEDLRRLADESPDLETFRGRLTQSHLMDLSNPDLHRWGRAVSPYRGEPYSDITEIRDNRQYMEDIRASNPEVYNAITGPGRTVTVYRAIPASNPATLIAKYERQKAHIMRRGKLPPEVSTSLTSSQYYNKVHAEVERLKTLPEDASKERLRIGDYVALDRRYAEMHGRSVLGGEQSVPYKVISKTVPKADVVWGEADWSEWAYSPKALREIVPSLEDLYEKLKTREAGPNPNILFQERDIPSAAHDIATILAARVAEESQSKKGLPLDRILEEMRASFPDIIGEHEEQIKATADSLLKDARRQALVSAARDPEQAMTARAELARDIADARRVVKQAEKAAEKKKAQMDAAWEADSQKAQKEAARLWDKSNAEWRKASEAAEAQLPKAEIQAQRVFERQQRVAVVEEARRITEAARLQEQARLEEIADAAREEVKRAREAAVEAIKSNVVPDARARRKQERESAAASHKWNAPIVQAASEARSRITADPDYTPTVDDLAAIASEKTFQAGMTGVQIHAEMQQYGPAYSKNVLKIRNAAAELKSSTMKAAIQKRVETKAVGRAEGLTKPAAQRQAREDYARWQQDELARLAAEEAWRIKRKQTEKRDLAREFAKLQKPSKLDVALDVLGLPISLGSSVDLPHLRQGIPTLMNHPTVWFESLMKSFSTWTEGQMETGLDQLERSRLADLRRLSGLKQSGLEARRNPLSRIAREEQFQNRIAQKLPHVRVSERQYTIGMDMMRAGVFDLHAEPLLQKFPPSLHPEIYSELARIVNITTGVGDLGSFTHYAPFLNRFVLYATRYLVSRFQMLGMLRSPLFYRGQPWEVRKIAAKEAYGYVVKMSLLFGALSAMGLTSLDVDDDFLKIRIPKTNQKWDPTGGMGGYVKTLFKLARSAYRKGTGQHEFTGDSAGDTIQQFIRSKLAPAPATIWDWKTGKSYTGEPFTWGSKAGELVTPMVGRDIYDAIKTDGARGLIMVPYGILGGNVSTYRSRKMSDRTQTEAERYATGFLRENMGQTSEAPADYKRRTLITELTAAQKAGKPTDRIERDLAAAGGPLSPKEKERVTERVAQTPLEHAYPRLHEDQKVEVLKIASEGEKRLIEPHYQKIEELQQRFVAALKAQQGFGDKTPQEQKELINKALSYARQLVHRAEKRAGSRSVASPPPPE